MGRRNKEKNMKADKFDSEPTAMVFSLENLSKFCERMLIVDTPRCKWTVHVYRGRIYETEYVVLDVHCHSAQGVTGWSHTAEVDVFVAGGKVSTHFEQKYAYRRTCVSVPTLLKWEDVVKPSNGFINADGRVLIELRVREVAKKTIRNAQYVSKDYPGITNLEIVVGKSRFRVNRELLAWSCGHFCDELHAGNLKESEPYVIDNIAARDFRLFLDLVYCPTQYFSSFFVKDMLAVAKRFRNTEILLTCQSVLVVDMGEENVSAKDQHKLAIDCEAKDLREMFDQLPTSKTYKPRFMDLAAAEELQKERRMKKFVERMRQCHLEVRRKKQSLAEEEEDIDQSIPSTSGHIY